MEQLIEQARKLVADLTARIVKAKEHQSKLDKQDNDQGLRQVQLDDITANLLDREANVAFIENISETQRLATQSKAEADLEWTKIRDEWEQIKVRKQSDQAEAASARNEIQEKRELYDRGAKENAITAAKLNEKLKKFNEATGRV